MNYYIQGDHSRTEEIREAFEKLGYDTSGHLFNAESVLYFTLNGDIRATTCNCTPAIIKTHPDYKELELPKPHYDISNFKPFDKVLVRDRDESKWGNTYFGFYDEEQKVFVCDCYEWEQCIPFEGNEHLLGTTDMCDEQYINW